MALVLLTFLITTTLYGLLFALALRRVLSNLKGNEEGIQALTKFVFLPLIGRHEEDVELVADEAAMPARDTADSAAQADGAAWPQHPLS